MDNELFQKKTIELLAKMENHIAHIHHIVIIAILLSVVLGGCTMMVSLGAMAH